MFPRSNNLMHAAWLTGILLLGAASPALAQDDTTEEDDPEAKAQTVIDDVPYVTPRAAAMGGAIAPFADDMDAAFNNPAGIGGIFWKKKKTPWFRKLYLPRIGVSANENGTKLNSTFKDEGGADDTAAGQAIVDAAAGDRQYARANVASGFVLSRFMYMPFVDYQVAAVSQGDDQIDTRYRAITGHGFGLSLASFDDSIYLGYFGYAANVEETRGIFRYDQLTDTEMRKEALRATTAKYSGVGHNGGIIWRIGKKASPTLGVSVINIGDTVLKRTQDPEEIDLSVTDEGTDTDGTGDETAAADTNETLVSAVSELPEEMVFAKDLKVSFGISPPLGKNGELNIVLQANRLNDQELTISQKMALGLEMNFGGEGFGTYRLFSLRLGGNHTGASGGLMLNLGIIGLEAASHTVDIGVGNEKVIERRLTGVVHVNVADF